MSNYYYLDMTHTVLLPVLYCINAELREAESQLDLIILSYIIIIIFFFVISHWILSLNFYEQMNSSNKRKLHSQAVYTTRLSTL